MGHPAARYYYPPARTNRKRSAWKPPEENRLKLSRPPHAATAGDWGGVQSAPECEAKTAEISGGYKAAIALLRSLRNVSNEEQQEQRETWELLEQALDEDRYH
jgi:hypothetical protein